MTPFFELLRAIRYAQAGIAVQYLQWDIERRKRALAKAFNALDAARADLVVHEYPLRDSEREVPPYLRKVYDADEAKDSNRNKPSARRTPRA
jgi:hypothetical protein